jgi:outer membrane protein assembly factor BamB
MRPTRVRRFLVCSAVCIQAVISQSALAVRAGPTPHLAAIAAPSSGPRTLGPHVPGAELWVQVFHHGWDFATSLGVSPDGTKVFVTGQSGPLDGRAYTTIAYDVSTGAELWIQRYGDFEDIRIPFSLGVSPDGTKVFVTGGRGSGGYATIAYDASTGATLWVELYEGGAARALEVSPDGTRVFVTGVSDGDYATIAYDASTGATLWVELYEGGSARALEVSRDGAQVFVTGESNGAYATIAYDASSGVTLWISRFEGSPGRETQATSVGVSPDGAQVFVTGGIGQPNGIDYGTIAYDAATGATLWVRHYGGGPDCCRQHVARSLGVSSDGTKVFVTGESERDRRDVDYATIAYDASTGATLWAKRFTRIVSGDDRATSLAVSPDGASVFVTGGSDDDYATIAYEASSGATLWVSSYRSSGLYGLATAIGVSPDGTKVFVTGSVFGDEVNPDYVTIAYSTT